MGRNPWLNNPSGNSSRMHVILLRFARHAPSCFPFVRLSYRYSCRRESICRMLSSGSALFTPQERAPRPERLSCPVWKRLTTRQALYPSQARSPLPVCSLPLFAVNLAVRALFGSDFVSSALFLPSLAVSLDQFHAPEFFVYVVNGSLITTPDSLILARIDNDTSAIRNWVRVCVRECVRIVSLLLAAHMTGRKFCVMKETIAWLGSVTPVLKAPTEIRGYASYFRFPLPSTIFSCSSNRHFLSQGLITSNCSGLCEEGYICPVGSSRKNQFVCGGTDVYCPTGSYTQTPVSLGYYTTGTCSRVVAPILSFSFPHCLVHPPSLVQVAPTNRRATIRRFAQLATTASLALSSSVLLAGELCLTLCFPFTVLVLSSVFIVFLVIPA